MLDITVEKLIPELIQKAQAENVQRFVVGAIIVKNNKALCLKRASHDFMGGIDELPSGKVEAGESLIVALVREVKEETGLDIEKIESYISHFDYKSKSGALTRQFNFLVIPSNNSKVQLSDEHEGYAWFSAKEIDRYQLSTEVKLLANRYFQKKEPALGQALSHLLLHPENKKRKLEEVDEKPEVSAAKEARTEAYIPDAKL